MRAVRGVARVWLSEDTGHRRRRVPARDESPRNGFGSDRRIRTSAEFEALLHGGIRRSLAGFTFFLSRRPAGHARLGILISRKHAARATDRNRIKRCIREAFRQSQSGLGALDLLVRPPFGLKASAVSVAKLRTCFEKLVK